ncbi:MAG TPA: sugar ABC transporter substrate-binding protein [Chloroflexota bacterium]|nr:sugar ABC transporter substrate-binding protein [Chloroflexota bacterium]
MQREIVEERPGRPGTWLQRHGLTRRRAVLHLGAGAGTAAAALTACNQGQESGRTESPPAKTLAPAKLVWAYWGNQEQAAVREEVFAAIQQRFPQLTIDKLHHTGGLDDHFAKVQVMVSSGSGLDLFMSSPIWVPNLAERSLYQPLDRLMARDKFPTQEWSKAALEAFSYRKQQYALPEILNYATVVYNQEVFAQAGEKPPPADWTWDQFVQVAQRLTVRQGSAASRWGIGPVSADLNNTLPWIWSNGGKIFDDEQDPKRSTFNTAAVADAVQWRADWAQRLGIAPKPDEITQPGDPFVQGFLAMGLTTVAGFATLAKNITAFTWDVAPLPRGKEGRFNFAGSAAQGLASGSKVVDQAWQVLQFQGSRDGLVPYMRAQWGVPPLLSLAQQDYLQLPGPPANRRAVVESLATLRTLPKMPAMLELYNQVYGTELGNVYAGKRTARDAAVDIDTQVQSKLSGK